MARPIDPERAFAALLLMQGYRDVMDSASTLQSSPWTMENVGADEDMADSMRFYLWQTTVSSLIMGAVGSSIAGTFWPMGGTLLGIGYLWYIYEHARNKALDKDAQGEGWFKQ
jgi:hypothetical protein